MNIRELREMTGLTQKDFAKKFNLPVGTLRRWEYGESNPAPYVIKLIADQLPFNKDFFQKIDVDDRYSYYYSNDLGILMDSKGTKIKVNVNINDIKEQNLRIYIQELFENYYYMIEKFELDCKLDKEESILWS